MEREHLISTPCSILNSPNVLFHIRHMFICSTTVEKWKPWSDWLKLWVCYNTVNLETSRYVQVDDILKFSHNCGDLSVVGSLNSTKLQMLGGGDQERNLVDKHDVDGQCYRPMNLHDIWWHPNCLHLDMWVGMAHCLSFERPKVRPKYIICCLDIFLGNRRVAKCLMITSAN